MSHLAIHAAKIVGAFVIIHHFLPKGYPYGDKEDWEREYAKNHGRLSLRRRSSPDRGSRRSSESEGPSRTNSNSTQRAKSVHFHKDPRQYDRRSQDWHRNEDPYVEYAEEGRYRYDDDERISRSRRARQASPR
ncbi:hypothetical protein B7494_g4827 [Chlorociboria aeruginascens]|nr:hypothetical protein B7494_g4827 [Chlorociboria aeruginascens]